MLSEKLKKKRKGGERREERRGRREKGNIIMFLQLYLQSTLNMLRLIKN